jgi:hypothetical protein
LLGFPQILPNEFAGFSGAFTGISPPAFWAVENHKGALAGIAAMPIWTME